MHPPPQRPLAPLPCTKKRSAPTISVSEYHRLVKKNLNGEFPAFALPPQQKETKSARAFPCQHPGCSYVGTTAAITRRHMGNIHGIGVEEHACDQPGCTYVGKWANQLKQHKQKAHNINVKWHCCPVEGCGFKTKTTPGLRNHMSARHEIGVVWHHCQMPGCNFKTKQRRNLFQHARWMHSGRKVLHGSRLARNQMLPSPIDPDRSEDYDHGDVNMEPEADDRGCLQTPPNIFAENSDEDSSNDGATWQRGIEKVAARRAAAQLGLLDPVCLPCAAA